MIDAAIIEKEAMQLPDTQRALLAERLLESISPTSKNLQAAWVRESDARLSSFRNGEIGASVFWLRSLAAMGGAG